MSVEQALGHTPGPGGGLTTLGKPRAAPGLGAGWAGAPAGEGGQGSSEAGGGLAGSCPPQTRRVGRKKTYEKKGLSCFLQMNGAAELHGLSSGWARPILGFLIPCVDGLVPTGCRYLCDAWGGPLCICAWGGRGMLMFVNTRRCAHLCEPGMPADSLQACHPRGL